MVQVAELGLRRQVAVRTIDLPMSPLVWGEVVEWGFSVRFCANIVL